MFEVVVGVSILALIFLAMSIVLAVRCATLQENIRSLERYSEEHKRSNDELKCSVKALKAECDRLYILAYSNPELEKMTALKMALHLKNEENEELREKVRKQNTLLKQKWEGSKKCS